MCKILLAGDGIIDVDQAHSMDTFPVINNSYNGQGRVRHDTHRIVFGSCYNPLTNGPSDLIWTSILNQSPDRLVLLGDNIYADRRLRPMTFAQATPKVLIPIEMYI